MVDQPVILVVTENEGVSDALVADLHRRFGTDYRVTSAASGETVVAMAAQVYSGGGRFIFSSGFGYPYYWNWYPYWGGGYPYSYSYYPSYLYAYDSCSVSRQRFFGP